MKSSSLSLGSSEHCGPFWRLACLASSQVLGLLVNTFKAMLKREWKERLDLEEHPMVICKAYEVRTSRKTKKTYLLGCRHLKRASLKRPNFHGLASSETCHFTRTNPHRSHLRLLTKQTLHVTQSASCGFRGGSRSGLSIIRQMPR